MRKSIALPCDWRYICAILTGYARVSTDDQDTAAQLWVLKAAGCYGHLRNDGIQREPADEELGIRVALGARKTHVLRAAVGRPMVLLGMGSVLGLLAGVAANRLLGQIVYQANPRDP